MIIPSLEELWYYVVISAGFKLIKSKLMMLGRLNYLEEMTLGQRMSSLQVKLRDRRKFCVIDSI